jgi:hypothetical protein
MLYNGIAACLVPAGRFSKEGFPMEKHFKVLRFIGSVYKIVGIIIAAITILSALGICGVSILGGTASETILQSLNPNGGSQGLGIVGGLVGGIVISLIIIIGGGIYAISIYALGEAVYLLIALEENTRRTAALLHHHVEAEPPALIAPPPPPPASSEPT